MKTNLLSKGAAVYFAASSSLSLSSVSAIEAAVAAAAASSDDLQPTRRQSSNSYAYASNHRALMRDDEQPPASKEEPDVASIVNGTETNGPLSYQVALASEVGYGPSCGGSLIAPRVVLTAAHCIGFSEPPDNKVLINGYDLLSGAVPEESGYIAASSYVIHPDHNATGNLENDIALWFLPFPIGEGENFKFATLNEDPNVPADGEELFVSGWGDTVYGVPSSQSTILLGTNLDYITNEQCQSDYDETPYPTVTDGMVCAARKGTAECSGDSGGPLMIANGDVPAMDPPIQVGIVSWSGKPCGTYPGVFTRVSSYVDWIRSTACEKVGELCRPSSKAGKSKYLP